MARPRTPSKILELRGSFTRHPERRRSDAAGAAEFCREPPANLTPAEIAAWHRLVERLPLIALYSCDELAVVQAARILAALGDLPVTAPEYIKLDAALHRWLVQLGCTPTARTKLTTTVDREREGNPFVEFTRHANRC